MKKLITYCFFYLLGVLMPLQAQHKTPINLDVNPGDTPASQPGGLRSVNGVLYFSGNTGSSGLEPVALAENNFVTVDDINLGGSGSSPRHFTSYNGFIYYAAISNITGTGIYRYDAPVPPILGTNTLFFQPNSNPSPSGIALTNDDVHGNIVKAGNFLYFTAQNTLTTGATPYNVELWVTDGTTSGTTPEINPNVPNATSSPRINGSSLPRELTPLTIGGNDYLFFTADSRPFQRNAGATGIEFDSLGNRELYVRLANDPASTPHTVLDVINPATTSVFTSACSPAALCTISGITTMAGARPVHLTPYGNQLYFIATSTGSANQDGLWRTNGTALGTTQVALPAGVRMERGVKMVVSNNILYFAAINATAGRELWKFDGTSVAMVKDIQPGAASGIPLILNNTLNIPNPIGGNLTYFLNIHNSTYNWIDINGTLFFAANDGTNGIELWSSDGTNANTVMLNPSGSSSGIVAGSGSAHPRKLANVNGVLYCIVRNALGYQEVWRHIPFESCDATFNATRTSLYYDIHGINPTVTASALLEVRVGQITPVGNNFYFIAQVDGFGTTGAEPWYAEGCPVAAVDYSPEPAIVNSVCKTASVTTATPGVTFTFTKPTSVPNTPNPTAICPDNNCFCSTTLGGAINPNTGIIDLNNPLATNGVHKICYQYKASGACGLPVCFDLNIQGAVTADVLAETVAGNGVHGTAINSTPLASRFNFQNLATPPVGSLPDDSNVNVAFSPDGTKMYVSDEFNHCIRQVDFTTNTVTTLAGVAGFIGSVDAPVGTSAGFFRPAGITTDQAGIIYVADKGNHTIRRINPTTTEVTTIAGTAGSLSGGYLNSADPFLAKFAQPSDVAIDANGNIYVADKNNHAIRMISPTGVVTTLAGSPEPSSSAGFVNGTGTAALFNRPCGIDFDINGDLLVADRLNHAIRRVTTVGVVTTFAGTGASGNTEGTTATAQFNQPTDVVVDAVGKVYVADRNNHKIRLIEAGTVSTYAGDGTAGYLDAIAPNARFQYPIGVATDPTDRVFVTDKNNARIRRIRLNNVGGQINGSTTVCSGTNSGTLTLVNYQGAPSTASITRWESSTNNGTTWTSLGNPTSATYNFNNLTANTIFRVIQAESACGTIKSDIATVNVIVPPTPTVTPTAVCGTMPATPVAVTVTASGGLDGEYVWYTSADVVIAGEDDATYSTTVTATTTFKVAIKRGVCESAKVPVVATVFPPPTPSVSGNSSACGSVLQTFTTNNNVGNTYEWRIDGALQATTTNSMSFLWGDADAGTSKIITVKETTPAPTNCATTSANFNVAVLARPAVQTVTGLTSVCLNTTQAYSIGGAGTFAWTITGVTATPSTGTGNSFSTLWGSVGTATLTWIETGANGCTRTNTQTITINDLPTVKTLTGDANICLGTPKTYSYTPTGANTSLWSVTAGSGTATIVGANNGTSASIDGVTAGDVNVCVTETDANGCTRQHCRTITINALPAVHTIAGNSPVCINTSQTYSVPIIGANTYTIAITGGNATVTSATSNTITTTFQQAGTADICITETNPATTCVRTYCRTITINALPTAQTITGATSVCLNSTQSYNISGAGTFTWTITGVTATPSTGTGNSFSTAWGSVGTGTITWTETDANSCARVNTQAITINDLPTVKTITGDANICLGAPKTYNYTPTGANTSLWSITVGSGTATIVGANNGTSVSIDGATAGDVNVCVTETDANGCSRQHCRNITINPLPSTQTITGNSPVCINTSQTYSVTPTGLNTYSIAITGGNATVTSATSNTITTTFQQAGTADVCVTETNPATSCVRTYCRTITINALPTAKTITGASNVCAGTSQTYNITGAGTYVWSIAGAGITATPSTGTGNSLTTTLSGNGTATITWTETDANSCATTNTFNATVHPLPTAPTFAPLTATCSGSTVTYTATGGSGTFEWEFTNVDNTVSTQTGATATFTWGTTATSVGRQVRVREISIAPANCQSPYFTQSITINPLPTKQTIAGETAVCVGEVESYSIPNTVGSSYTWKVGTTNVGTGNPANITWATAGSFTLTVEETNANGCKQIHDIPFTVIVTPLPTPVITGTNTGICANTTHTYTVAVLNNTNTHTWTVTNGTINSGQGTGSISVTWDNVATGTISVVETTPPVASCAGTSPLFTVNMSVAPAQPDIAGATVTGNTGAVCANSVHTYNAVVPVSGTDTYTWEVTGGQIDGTLPTKSGVGLSNVSVTWGSTVAGTLKLRRISPAPASCSSTDDLVNITINPLPTTQTITGATTVCQGQTVTYSIPNNPTNTFRWTVTGGKIMPANLTTQQAVGLQSVNIQWDNAVTAGKVELVETSILNCEGAKITVDVIVNPTPTITSITPVANTCGTSAVSYTITGTGLTGATFDWTVTNGSPAVTPNGTNTLTITWNDVTALTTGIISITPKTASCTGTAFVQNININPLPANQTVTGATVVCLNSTEAYSLTGSVLSNYTWVVTSTTAGIASPASGTGASASILWQQVGTATVEFEETILATGCKKKYSRAITINTTPATPVITGGTTVCQNGSSTFSVSNPNNYTVLWEALTGGAINGANNANTVMIDWTGTGTGSLRLTLSAGSCSANSTQTVTIIAPPNVNFTPIAAQVCLGQTTTHVAPDAPAGQVYEYTWTTNGGTIVSGATAKTLVTRWNLNNGTEYVRLKVKVVGTNCEVTSPLPATPTDLGFVTVNPLPTPDVTGDNLVCPSEVVNYTTANVAGNTYIWSVINGTAVTAGNNVTVTWNSTAGAGKVIVIQTITATGCLQSDTLNVTISPLPALPTSPDRSVCNPPKTIDLNATSAGATSYTWYDAATGGTVVASTQIYSPNITTNISFWVSATNAAGCESVRKEVKIVVNPASTDLVITPTLVNADSCVASGDSPSGKIILALQGSNAPYTFVWTKAGVPAFTATTQSLTAITRGDYQVTITDAGGCTTVSPVYTILEQLKNLQDAKIIHQNIALTDNQQIIIPEGLPTNLKAEGTDAVKFEWKDATGAVISTNQTYIFTPTQQGDATYTVKVTNDRNCSMTRIVRVKVVQLITYVPNIFTPNNDTKNDKLQVYGNGIKSVKFKVYNRLGEVVFETDKWVEGTASSDTNIGWDGFYKGKLQEAGNYTWLLSVTYINETSKKETGNVYLKQ